MPSYSEYKATFWETASSEVIAHSCFSLTVLHPSPLSENPEVALKKHQNFKPYRSTGSPCCASCSTEQPQNSYATAISVRTFSSLCASKWHIKAGRCESIKKYTLSTDMIVSRKTKYMILIISSCTQSLFAKTRTDHLKTCHHTEIYHKWNSNF